MTYFELFDLSPSYHIDLADLKTRFLKLSRFFHPDRFVLKPDAEKNEAEEKSALINKAFKILSNEDSRLKYLLELHHVIKEEEIYTLSEEFLMEMMDINDLIQENREEAINQLIAKENELAKEIEPVLNSYGFHAVDPAALQKIKEYHYKRRYLWRLNENIKGNMDL